jgi:hypothetical protein
MIHINESKTVHIRALQYAIYIKIQFKEKIV